MILIGLVILIAAFPVIGTAEPAFDPDTDLLLQDMAARSHSTHDNSLGYPGNEDIRLDGFYDWYLKNEVGHAMMNNAGDPNDVTEDHGAMRIENEVIRFFAPLYGFDPDGVWGLVTMSAQTETITESISAGIAWWQKPESNPSCMYPPKRIIPICAWRNCSSWKQG